MASVRKIERRLLCFIRLKRECHSLPIQPFKQVKEICEGSTLIILVCAKNAGKAFFAVKWYPCKLSAVIVQKARRKTYPAPRCNICQGGIVVGAYGSSG